MVVCQSVATMMTCFAADNSLKDALEAGAYPIAYQSLDVKTLVELVKQITAEKAK